MESGFVLEGAQFEAGVFVVVVGGGGGGALAEVEADGASFGGGFRKGRAEEVEGEGLARGEGLGQRAEGAGFGEVVAVGEETPSTTVQGDGSDVGLVFFLCEIEACKGFLVRIGVGEELPRAESRAGGRFIFPIGAVGGVGRGVGVCGGCGWFG